MRTSSTRWQWLVIVVWSCVLASCNELAETSLPPTVSSTVDLAAQSRPESTAKQPTSTATQAKPTPTELVFTQTPRPECNGQQLILASEEDQTITFRELCVDWDNTSLVDLLSVTLDSLWHFHDFSVSNSGRYFAFTINGPSEENKKGRILLFDMLTEKLVEVYLGDIVTSLEWSADDQYLGYIRLSPPATNYLEVIHLPTGTPSELLNDECDNCGDYFSILGGFSWSYMNQLAYVISESEPQFISSAAYVANIDCDDRTHSCSLGDPIRVGWYEWGDIQWAGKSSSLVNTTDADDICTIQIRDLAEETLYEVALNEFQPPIISMNRDEVSVSDDGKAIAFFGEAKSWTRDLRGVYILSVPDNSITFVSETVGLFIQQVEWVP